MSNFLEELKNIKIISKNDIENIKKYINIKYKDEDSQKKAYMVSSTIHSIIENKIISFPKSIQKDLKNTIFKNTFLKNKDSIYLWDIFYSYMDYINFKKENIEMLLNWLNANIENKIDEEHLINYLYTNNLLNEPESKKHCEISSNTDNNSIYLKNTNIELNNNVITIKESTPKIITYKYNLKSILKKFNINSLYENILLKLYNNSIAFTLVILFISMISIYLLNINNPIKTNSKNIIVYENKNLKTKRNNLLSTNNNLPKYVRYKTLNNKKLKNYLYKKNSLLTEEPYFSSIIAAAEEFDINPLILFAITGQEQGFVPKNNKFAKKMANNPFNVFHSWEEYNSDIKDSSRIAARTVFNLLKTMPKEQDPFKWINNTYAEDINWHKGVKSLYNDLEKAIK